MPIAAANAPLARRMQRHSVDAADLLKSLAHSGRLLVLCLLADGELSVGEMERQLELSQSALSQHLALLRDRGIVTTRREAQSVYYRLAPGPWVDVLRVLQHHYCAAPGRAQRPR